jgi:hypothetical protein
VECAVVAGFLDAVGVGAGALDDAGVAALVSAVQVLAAGDVGLGEGVLALVMVRDEKAGSADGADDSLVPDAVRRPQRRESPAVSAGDSRGW